MRILAALLLAFVLTFTARAAEPWLKAGDVVALVGGEDMVALAEEGWLETLVTWAQPKDRIRFRSLAWEGDTVFEQRRDLNYPALEAHLDQIGATVVICQFGKMESFAGKDGVAAFTEAYEKLLARLNPEGKRRIALVLPPRVIPWEERERLDQKMHEKWVEQLRESGGKIAKGLVVGDVSKDRKEKLSAYIPGQPLLGRLPDFGIRNTQLAAYRDAICAVGTKLNAPVLDSETQPQPEPLLYGSHDGFRVPNGMQASWIASNLEVKPMAMFRNKDIEARCITTGTAITAKNRMWFHYTRPQNWAFLAGNRTNQPSSRDHRDPTRRWFPEEMEQWLPLIEAKEKEIWALAAAPR